LTSVIQTQIIQEEEFKIKRKHFESDELDEDHANFDIQDVNSFHKAMKCIYYENCFSLPRDLTSFVACNENHEFCKRCLKNYYRILYSKKDLRSILFDKYICPVCKKTSVVENSHDTLRDVFGDQYQVLEGDDEMIKNR